MNGIPFIYNIPKKFFFSTFYPAFSISSKEHGSIMNDICTEHPYFSTTLYSSQSGNPAVWMCEINCLATKSRMGNIEKRFMTVAFFHFSIIVLTKSRSYLYSSFNCNWVNVFRHVYNIWVSNLLPNSLRIVWQEKGD